VLFICLYVHNYTRDLFLLHCNNYPVNLGFKGPSWLWLYGCLIYNYLCNQYLSPLTLWVRIPLRRGVLYTTLCDEVCQWLATGQWFSPGTLVSSTNKADCHDITEILLKVALNTIYIQPIRLMIYILFSKMMMFSCSICCLFM
jgi:hypothetical protein